MQCDTTLNVVWAVLGLLALACTARAALRDNAGRNGPRWLLIVLLVSTALFPYISASDDILRIDQGPATSVSSAASGRVSPGHSQSRSHHPLDDLLRLYETLDTPLIARLLAIVFTILLIAFVYAWNYTRAGRTIPDVAGRSPPRFARLTLRTFK